MWRSFLAAHDTSEPIGHLTSTAGPRREELGLIGRQRVLVEVRWRRLIVARPVPRVRDRLPIGRVEPLLAGSRIYLCLIPVPGRQRRLIEDVLILSRLRFTIVLRGKNAEKKIERENMEHDGLSSVDR